MNTRPLQRIVDPILLAATLAVNALAVTLPLNGRTTGEISDRFNSLFTPAGYVFGIWSLIYLGLIGYVIYEWLPAGRAEPRLKASGWWFALTCVANGLWIVLWHYGQYVLTIAVMAILLTSLIVIYRRWHRGEPTQEAGLTRWLALVPFSLYLGWISVATVANASVVLLSLGWDGGGLSPAAWTVTMIAVTTVLSLAMSYRHRDVVFTGVIVWALVGILVKQSAVPAIATASVLAMVACVGGLAWALWRSRRAYPLAAG